MTTESSVSSSSPADPVAEAVADRWAKWYPDLASTGAQLRLVRVHGRRHSTVHEFVIGVGPDQRLLFVKRPAREGGRRPDRPYGVPSVQIPARHRAQADALDALRDAIDADDSALGAARVLDVIDDLDLVVTEAAEGRPIRSILIEQVWWTRGRNTDLSPTFANAGKLLRRFHEHVPTAGPTLLSTRRELVEAAERFTDYLSKQTGAAGGFVDLHQTIRALAERHIPEEIEPVTRFGDFGLTNVFSTPAHRVTAIDTLAACRTPALHDLTYFITGMYLLRPQVMTMGRAISQRRLARYEHEFLIGYFGTDMVPWGAYRTWSVVRALERWSAKSLRHRGGIRGRVIDRYIRSWVDAQLSMASAVS